MNKKIKAASVFLGIILFFSSCSEPEYCTLPTVAKTNIGFYTQIDGELEEEVMYGFWACGLGTDSLINSDTSAVKSLSLELSESNDSCSFIFRFNVVIDTLTPQIIIDTIIDLDTIPNTPPTFAFDSILSELPDTLPGITQYLTITFTDTLQFNYKRQLYYISPACGFIYNYELGEIQYTKNYIDTILIVNPLVNTSNEEKNVQILF